MNILLITIFIVGCNAGHLGLGLVGPGTHGTVLQGPGSHTALIGPDGSHISAAVAGGTVVAPPQHGGVVSAAVVPGIIAGGHGIGSGLEGQYVHDFTETLYDDGSYKGDLYDGHY